MQSNRSNALGGAWDFSVAVLLSIACIAPSASTRADEPSDAKGGPQRPALSMTGSSSLEALMTTAVFAAGPTGNAGTLPASVCAFGVLKEEPNADQAFKYLIKRGSAAGLLYGLAGLFFTDRVTFLAEAERLARQNFDVSTQNGCVISSTKSAQLIRSDARDRIEIDSQEALKLWFKQHSESGALDMLGGGYPSILAWYASQCTRSNPN